MSSLFATKVNNQAPVKVTVIDKYTLEEKTTITKPVKITFQKTYAGTGAFDIRFTLSSDEVNSYIRQQNAPDKVIFGDKTPPANFTNIFPRDIIKIEDFGVYEDNYLRSSKQGVILTIDYTLDGQVIYVAIQGVELRYQILSAIVESDFVNGYDTYTNQPVETIIKSLLEKNRKSNTLDPEMNEPRLNILQDFGRGEVITDQYRFQNLKDLFQTFSESYEMGNNIWVENNQFYFDVITPSQVVKLNYRRGELGELSVTLDSSQEFNSLLVGGSGELESRQLVLVDDDSALIEPIGSLKTKDFYNLSSEDAKPILGTKGMQKLEEIKMIPEINLDKLEFDLDIEKDFFIGDYVSVEVAELGITLTLQLTEYEVVYEENKPPIYSLKFGRQNISTNVRLLNKISYNQ